MSKIAASELTLTPAWRLAELIRKRKISPTEVVNASLERIEKLDTKINAMTTVLHDKAKADAIIAEKAIMSGESLGPLHGLPVSIKETTATKGVVTSFGSKTFKDNVPDVNDLSVDKLLAAGAIFIGKTTAPEFGMKGITDNPLHGITNNPWNTEYTVGGSSGGAAAAVAAGMCALSQGSDWGGSVRIPASCCGVVGFKPSFGRIPLFNKVNSNFRNVAHMGPMGRNVKDVALMLNSWIGDHSRDPYSLDSSGINYLKAIEIAEIKNMKIAYSDNLGLAPVDREVKASFDKTLDLFTKDLGAKLDEISINLGSIEETFMKMWTCEAAYLVDNDLNGDTSDADPSLVKLAEEGRKVSGAELIKALYMEQGQAYNSIAQIFETHDLLITPTLAVPPFKHPENAQGPSEIEGQPINPLGGWLYTYPFNITGHPAISIPCGFSEEGLPIGLQIVGARHQDDKVLEAAAAFEAVSDCINLIPNVVCQNI